MTKGHVFIAMSLDGFIARPDHALDWLMKQKTEGEDHGYDAFLDGVDGLVMGTGTFRTVLGFPDWPYPKPVVVMSRTLTAEDIPAGLRDRVRVTGKAPAAVMAELAAAGWRRAYIDGGGIIRAFLAAGLIEEMTVTVVPILIGAGRPLFGGTGRDIDLELVSATPFPSGLVRMRYRVG